MPPWTLTTPSTRGLSLALTRHLLRTTKTPLVATTRSDPSALRDAILSPADPSTYLSPKPSQSEPTGRTVNEETAHILSKPGDESRLHILKLDFHSEESIASAAAECASLFPPPGKDAAKKTSEGDVSYLHLGILLPGVLYPEKSPSQLDAEKVLDTFKTNVIGPLLVLKHFAQFLPKKTTPVLSDLPGLPKQAVWAALSARVGSISDNTLGGWYSYRASKAGVSQMQRTFDNYLKTTSGERALAVALHPGTVKTGLSKEFWGGVKEDKLFRPEFSAEKLANVIRELKVEQRGKLWDWQGKEIAP